jgi:arabinoxylan arabinofuranohydrolase
MKGMTMILKAAKKQYLRNTMIGILILLGVISAKAESAEISYPFHFTYNGNPLVRNHGAADPDVHVWDDTIWLYCSQDHEVINGDTYKTMDGYHAFSSTDMVNWTDHGEILHSRDVSWGTDGYMWAPGAARKNGKYYLYYPHQDKKGGWLIGVAISDVPQGPFKDIGHPIEGPTGIDPAVFIDDDGQAYIYYGSHMVAKLKENMIELAEKPRVIDYAPQDVLDDDLRRFHEGPFMHKRNGIYYYSYSNFKNHKYQGWYAMADNPYGPFKWIGPMAPNPQGAQDHHSLIEFKGQWYYFYHIAVDGIPKDKEGQGRIACFDRLYYNKDGTIQTVAHTRGPTKVLTTSATNGSVILDPPGGAYTPGTKVTLTAAGDLGYAFSGWSGDLAVAGNPATMVVDSDITVTATFKTAPTYTLSVKSPNGAVYLVPPGGRYNAGTVVSLVPVDDFGYDFSTWDGDLAGTGNPGKITMDSDKQVKAYFKAVPTCKIAINASNGIIELNPPGGRYEKGEKVTLTAKQDFGYRFVSWGGDLAGTNNPLTISLYADKNAAAIFEDAGGKKITLAINCGGAAFRSDEGVYYIADNYAQGGGTFGSQADISGTTEDYVYQSERMGSRFGYDIPLPNGQYEVTLMFAEIYFNAAGKRVFDVEIGGKPAISNLDICSKVGPLAACELTYPVALDDGQLNISFKAVKENAKISAIKVIKR